MADRYTREELLARGYTTDEIDRVEAGYAEKDRAGGFPARDAGDGWTPWLLTSSSNIAAIRYNAGTQELQVQFHPASVKNQVGRASRGGTAGHGHGRAGRRVPGGKRLGEGWHPHGHDSGNYPRFTAGSFSEGYGPIWGYTHVPPSLWERFESASDSYGEFFHANVRNRYGDHKISG